MVFKTLSGSNTTCSLLIYLGSVFENNPYKNSAYFISIYTLICILKLFFLSFLYFFSIFLDYFKAIFYLQVYFKPIIFKQKISQPTSHNYFNTVPIQNSFKIAIK